LIKGDRKSLDVEGGEDIPPEGRSRFHWDKHSRSKNSKLFHSWGGKKENSLQEKRESKQKGTLKIRTQSLQSWARDLHNSKEKEEKNEYFHGGGA